MDCTKSTLQVLRLAEAQDVYLCDCGPSKNINYLLISELMHL